MGQILIPTDETFPKTADVVVIGGGIVGVATAFWLSRAGLDTVLVEMRDGLSTLTTPESIESFRAQFTEPAMSALAQESINVFENFADVIGIPGYDIDLHHQGYLFVTEDPDMVDEVETAVKKHHELGVTDSEFLTGDEARKRFPDDVDAKNQWYEREIGRLLHPAGCPWDALFIDDPTDLRADVILGHPLDRAWVIQKEVID